MDRMKFLVEKLNEAARVYYSGGDILMTDFEYDKLYDELVVLERDTGVVSDDSPTRNVGADVGARYIASVGRGLAPADSVVVDELVKVAHESPMLSLDKTKDIDRLGAFLGDRAGVLSIKLDGLAIAVTYEGGRLVRAVTRGNGLVGEDVTHNALVFANLPKVIEYNGRVTVKGEAVISFETFERINGNADVDEQYKNPRNLTSGTVRQLNSAVCAKRNVEFFALAAVFSVSSVSSVQARNDGAYIKLKSGVLKWLAGQGFAVAEYAVVNGRSVEEKALEFKQAAADGNYATDGLVLTFDDIEYSRSLGVTSKFPRDSIAFKWADETAETVLRDIIWSVSRTGLINPIALFEPVDIEGSTIERASLHNVSIVEELGLAVGDTILVYKANMIIPQVAQNLSVTHRGTEETEKCVTVPQECPACGAAVEVRDANGVKTLYCNNPGCSAQVVRRITHYASRDALNIEGFSVQTVEKFVERGFLNDFTDIYTLENYETEIKAMRGFGERSYNALVKAIEKSKSVRLANFIYGLGIAHVGLSNAKLLCKYYDDDFARIKAAKAEQLSEIEGFGEVLAGSVTAYFGSENGLRLAERALVHLVIDCAAPPLGGATPGRGLKAARKTFVITGDTKTFKNRAELAAFIELHGGKTTGSVSAKTDYLVNNDINSNSGKNKKAKELGVEIISEDMLREILG